MTIQIGDIYEVFYNEGNHNNIPKIYVLAIVDDDMIVLKYWRKQTRRWIYKIVHADYFTGAYIELVPSKLLLR